MIIMDEFKYQLMGQREGLQLALDMLEIHKKSLENSIKQIDSQLKEIK